MRLVKKKYVAVFVLVLLFVLEIQFSIAELTIGHALEFTNSYRDKKGTVWELALKRQSAAADLGVLRQEVLLAQEELENIHNFKDISSLFEVRDNLMIPENKFLEVYRNLSRLNRERIIPPMNLIQLTDEGVFRKAFFSKAGAEINLFLLDNNNETVYQTVLPDSLFIQAEKVQRTGSGLQKRFLEESELIVNRNVFKKAYLSIDADKSLQVVNDPHRFIDWGQNFLRVAILPPVRGERTFIFEIRSGIDIIYESFQARELAAAYLIQRINEINGQ